jgi:hypothetical protein
MSCASEVMLKWRDIGPVEPAARDEDIVLFITVACVRCGVGGMRTGHVTAHDGYE